MMILAVLCFTSLTGLCLWLVATLIRQEGTPWTRSGLMLYTVLLAAVACLLFRPHEDTFIGLDTSAYRNMVRAFEAGRGFHDVDEGLMVLPGDARRWALLSASHKVRDTRDRSFEIDDLDTGETTPFFYPVLPLAMWGMQMLVPFSGSDYFVPLLGLLFMAGLLAVCMREGGFPGALLAIALAFGTPIIAWQMRGAHVEAVSAVLFGLVGLRSFSLGRITADSLNGLAIGAACLLHPVMLLPGAVLMLGGVVDRDCRLKGFVQLLGGAAVFGIVLLLFTEYVSAPYGGIGLRDTMIRLRFSATHRLAMAGAGVVMACCVVGVRFRERISSWMEVTPRSIASSGVLIAIWALPLVCSLIVPLSGDIQWIRRGLYDFYTGFQPWMTALLLVLVLIASGRAKAGSIWVLTAAFSTLPMFLYLKGAEPMGYWSLRRVVVPYVLLVSILAPLIIREIGRLNSSRVRYGLVAAIVLVSVVNPLLWPDPYHVRNEEGSESFVRQMRKQLSGAAVYFETFNDSLPFSVTQTDPVYGVCDEEDGGIAEMAPSVAAHASDRPTYWVSPFINPGLEEGVMLKPRAIVRRTIPRIRAKWTFPVVTDEISERLRILEAIPVTEGLFHMDKQFDGGRLGLRGDWGRMAKGRNQRSEEISGMWSRQESAVIGPVAPAGGVVEIHVEASSGRPDVEQTVHITPPWGGKPVVMTFASAYGVQAAQLDVPEVPEHSAGTGVYMLSSPTPYNPADDGEKGYRKDLGVLVFRIRMRAEAASQE